MTDCAGINSRKLMELTGITYRQLDYWCLVGYIEPHNHTGRENGNPGSGHFRCWMPIEVTKVQLFQQLVALGIKHENAWTLLQQPGHLEWFRQQLADIHDQLTNPQPVNNLVEEAV